VKVLLICNSTKGGAGGAAYRLYQNLQGMGVHVQMLTQNKEVDDDAVMVAPKSKLVKLVRALERLLPNQTLDHLPLSFYPHRDRATFSLQWVPDALASKVAQLGPDVVNLHWICNGMLRIETLSKLQKPIVWTLHDMWAFTGGCHLSDDCDRYTDACGACPRLKSSKDLDLSRWVWRRKSRAWKDFNLTLVTPSSWLAKCARSSSLFKNARIEVIPNGIDIARFKPIDRQVAREWLNWPHKKKIVLFGAWENNYRKGFHLLQPALQSLSKSGWQDKVEVVVFGFSQPSPRPDLGFKSHYLGRLSDDISLALAYAAADVFVAPSLQDNLPTTVMEAIACGTPCVAFNIGGMADLIEHQQNGYLAQPYQVEDLARGIAWVLEDGNRYQRLSQRARQKAEQEFALELFARRYQALFSEMSNDIKSEFCNEKRTATKKGL